MDWLWNQFIANKQKAVVGFIITAVVAFFAKHGVDLDSITLKQALEALLWGILGFVGVYIKRNKQ